jgi:transcriptional regulator with XRE-family HTH domain
MDSAEAQKKFADRLVDLMEEKGLNKTTLAAKVGINRCTLRNWILYGSHPQLDNLWKLSDFFGCSVGYLIGKEDY